MTINIPPIAHVVGSFSTPHSFTSQNILLDSSIRDWVVLPLLIIMVFAGMLRHYLSLLLKASAVKKMPKVEQRIKSTLTRSSRLRSGAAGFISKQKWEARVRYWTDDSKGYLKEEMQWIEEEQERQKEEITNNKEEEKDDNMPDPMAMLGPMKGQFAFMAQNMILMQGIGYFFSGYVLVKVPIPLTNGFKMMFQRGLDLSTLETSYVSSVSWYFLVMFGLRAFFKLVIDGNGNSQKEHMEAAMVQTQLGNIFAAGGGPQKKFDSQTFIKGEIESLELSKYKSVLDDADTRLLGKKYSKKLVGAANGPGFDIFGAAANNNSNGKDKTKVKAKAR
jgi:hypothetical protein